MEIHLMIEGQEGVTWSQWQALADAADRHGLAGLFTSDHYLSFHRGRALGSFDSWTALSALAARTDRIRLGTLVSPVTFRHPSVLAKAAVTVDHVSGGRVELGMGAGWNEPEHVAYGFPFPEPRVRLEMLAEQLRIVHESWTEESLSHEGRHYRLAESPGVFKPVQAPHPPLIVGGHGGPRSVALAARWADEYDMFGKGPEEFRRVRGDLDREAESRGRDPAEIGLSLMMGTVVGVDRAEVLERARRLLERRGARGDAASFLDDVRDRWLVGTVEEVAERIRRYGDAGVGRVYLQHHLHEDLEMVAVVGRELIPALS